MTRPLGSKAKLYVTGIASLLCLKLFAGCPPSSGITPPAHLPDPKACWNDSRVNCHGWEPLGETLTTADLIASGPGQLYQFVKGNTTCLYLFRNSGSTLNGVHCYNIRNCEVCAFDGKTPNVALSTMESGPAVKDDCSRCHLPGPLLPREKIWQYGRDISENINQICAENGGARWLDAPPSWRQDDLKSRVTAPNNCASCHTHFVRHDSMCGWINAAVYQPNGAMRKYAWDKTNPKEVAECKDFSLAMKCQLPCQ